MSKSQIPFIVDLWHFLKKPQWGEPQRFILGYFFQSLAWGILGALCFGFLIMVVIMMLEITPGNSVVSFVESTSWYRILFYAAVVAPILEELVFRLPLTAKRWMWYAWLITLGLWLVLFFDLTWWSKVVLGMGVSSGIISIERLSPKAWTAVVKQIQRIMVYSSILLFGVIHLLNYEELPFVYGGIFIFVLPQIWGGMMMTYLRVRQSFLSAVAYHMAYNFLLVLPVVALAPTLTKEVAEFTSTDNLLVFSLTGFYAVGSLAIIALTLWSIVEAIRYARKQHETL